LKSFSFLIGVLFSEHLLLGSLLSLDMPILNQVVAALHSLFVIGLFYYVYKNQEVVFKDCSGFKPALYMTLAVHLGMLLGIALLDSSGCVLWVVDSYNIHVPGSLRVMEFLKGQGFGSRTSIYDRTYLAHVLAGISFFIFGVNQIASGLALMIGKLGAVFYLFRLTKELIDERAARLASLVYIILPTALFYTITFYKEATVQFLVAMVSYYLIKVYRYGRWQEFLLLCLGLLFLGNERHYLVPCYFISAGVAIFASRHISLRQKTFITLSGFLGYLLFRKYYYDMNFQSLWASLQEYRQIYLSYSDVREINKTLPYPLALIKLYFTPFFTVRKLEEYSMVSALITWGSFVYEIIAFMGVMGLLFIKKKKNCFEIFVLSISMILFHLVFAYVAPYNGRLRDSFLSTIILISILYLQNKIKPVMRVNGWFKPKN